MCEKKKPSYFCSKVYNQKNKPIGGVDFIYAWPICIKKERVIFKNSRNF